MDDHIQWLEHKGKRILCIDTSNMREEGKFLELLEDLEVEVLNQPEGQKILLLFNSPNTLVTTKITERGKQITVNAKAKGIPSGPVAIIGSTGFQKAVISALQVFLKDIHMAESIEEAKDWLAAQDID